MKSITYQGKINKLNIMINFNENDMNSTSSIQSLLHIRVMMLEIRNRIDVPVEINEGVVRSLYVNLLSGNYDTIMMYHGEEFTTALMKLYEEVEAYEVCAALRNSIKTVNDLINKI